MVFRSLEDPDPAFDTPRLGTDRYCRTLELYFWCVLECFFSFFLFTVEELFTDASRFAKAALAFSMALCFFDLLIELDDLCATRPCFTRFSRASLRASRTAILLSRLSKCWFPVSISLVLLSLKV